MDMSLPARFKTYALFVPLMAANLISFYAFSFGTTTVTIDPAVKYQTFEGWGTSLCWWANLAGRWSPANRDKLISAILDPDSGLGYNCFRYNIGGGDQPGHNHMTKGGGGAAMPGFKPAEAGAYDWTADSGQRNILLGIAAKGKNLIFEAFSNSPPWWMTISGCTAGNTGGADNLKAAYFTVFADYLTEVVKHYRDSLGIVFRTLEPFNEPSSGYWVINGGQEGCGFKSQQATMVKEIGKKLVAKGLLPQTKASAADETALDQAVNGLKSYDDSAFSFMSQINAHTYGGESYRHQIDSVAVYRGKILWQSESGPLSKPAASEITLWMSDVILHDLRDMKPNAWLDWQIGDPASNWQSIVLNHTTQTFTYAKRFYMHAAFSRFIRPGSRIIASSDTNTVAALVPCTGNLVIVLRNGDSLAAKNYTFDCTRFGTLGSAARIYRYSLTEDLVRQPDVSITGKSFSIIAPVNSITTCVVSGAVTAVRLPPEPPGSGYGAAAITLRGRILSFQLFTPGNYTVDLFTTAGKKAVSVSGKRSTCRETVDLARFHISDGLYLVTIRQEHRHFSGTIVLTAQ